MESFYWYKDYGIRYIQLTGTTMVECGGSAIKKFVGKGEIDGNKLAKEYIDELVRWKN